MPTSIVNKREYLRSPSKTIMDNVCAELEVSRKEVNANVKISAVADSRYVEVFLLYPLLVSKKRFDIKNFFHSQLNDIDKRLAGQSVFLSQEIASQYNRFTGNHHCILMAYVPDAAIEGRSHGLVLRKGCITRTHVYDCMIMTGHGMQRWLNPEFNEEFRIRCCL